MSYGPFIIGVALNPPMLSMLAPFLKSPQLNYFGLFINKNGHAVGLKSLLLIWQKLAPEHVTFIGSTFNAIVLNELSLRNLFVI